MTSDQNPGIPDVLMADLVAVLDLVILERLPGGAMFRVGDQPPPAWFADTFHKVHRRQAVTLLEAFPVLDSFLSEAEIFWERTEDGRLEGETCVVTGPGGDNLPLALVAVANKGRHFLLLQRVAGFDDRQHILQLARERALEHERVVKRIDHLQRPLAALARLAGELGEMELGEPQRRHLASMTGEIHTLRKLFEELPQMPKGSSARRR
ncbi:MAG TPA: hypothetical protein VJ813_15770 [Vicinamibacterales bacterium]|nr:hypothetical protein [Vicinamibacterales bacterium]